MKAFQAKGCYKNGRIWQDFDIQIAAEDAEAATEKTLSTLGSKHKVKRWEIQLDSVEEIPNDKITNPVVKYIVEGN
jgi:large subunit ribosomal protein LX